MRYLMIPLVLLALQSPAFATLAGLCGNGLNAQGQAPVRLTVRAFLALTTVPAAVHIVHEPGTTYQVLGMFGGWDQMDEALPATEVRKVMASPLLLRVTHLQIQTRPDDHAPVAKWVAASPNVANLERLTFRYSALTGNDLWTILGSPHVGRLKDLELGGTQNGYLNYRFSRGEYRPTFSNFIGASGMRAIGGCANLGNLIRLDVSHNATSVGDTFLDGLTESKILRKLAYLNVGENYVTGAGFLRFANSSTAESLEEIVGAHGIRLSQDEAEGLLTSKLKREIKISLAFSATDWPAELMRRLHEHFPNVQLPSTVAFEP